MHDRDFETRALEGETLARSAGRPEVDVRLTELLLDPEDTAVTYRTALALLDRRDQPGLALIVDDASRADDDTSQWIADAVGTFRAASFGADDEFLRDGLTELARNGIARAKDLMDYVNL